MNRALIYANGALASVVCCVLLSGSASADRIMNQMGMIDDLHYSMAKGNHSGGSGVFRENYSLQLSDDFYTTSTGYVITEVEVGNVTFGVEQPATAWVSIYEVAGGSGGSAFPRESAVYDARHEVTRNTKFDDRVFGLVGLKTTISDLNIWLWPNTQYFLSIQTESSDFAFTALAYRRNGSDSFLRDNGRNGYKGQYGFTTWRSHARVSFEVVDAAYRIEAVPEPVAAALLLMLAGAACTVRRRRPG